MFLATNRIFEFEVFYIIGCALYRIAKLRGRSRRAAARLRPT
jgi:hypothetical protein